MNDDGLPLAYFRQHGADVVIHCGACGGCQVIGLEKLIARLTERGMDGEAVGVNAAARYVRAACECGARRWTSQPAWPPRPGQDGTKA